MHGLPTLRCKLAKHAIDYSDGDFIESDHERKLDRA